MAFVLFEQSSMMWALYDVSRTGSRQSEVPNHGTGIVSCSCQTYSCHYEKRCPSEIYYRISFDLIHDNVDHECLCLQDKANFVTSVQTRMTSKTYVDELFVFRYARVQDAVTVSSPNISVQRLVEVEGVCVCYTQHFRCIHWNRVRLVSIIFCGDLKPEQNELRRLIDGDYLDLSALSCPRQR